ncbi:MAG TPA: DUF1800 family protein [Ilumatobacter sp.]|nr:DUF1800 family protein [Ilumatobacter sp.]
MPATAQIEHLLRRTEFVARPNRVAELVAKPSLEAAVDDVMNVWLNPGGTATITRVDDWGMGEEYSYWWFDRMAFDSPRPMQEKMAMFWHGHFCTSLWKIELFAPLRDQIDFFRTAGLGNLRTLATTMSTQPAMLRYLDNDQNFVTSPNQNFGRELMELFLLGVGNYTEADVQAVTAAWTGHTDVWTTGQYVWRPDLHDSSPKWFLGRKINTDPAAAIYHGYETIDVMLGTNGAASGTIPAGAAVVANRGRPSRAVAAEFLSRKLWAFFAGTTPPGNVIAALRDVALANGFAIKPWVRALLLRPEFYGVDVMQGLVRSPVDAMVAYQYATGLRARQAVPLWWLDGMGQRPLVPPDVSGWKHNAYYLNASAMGYRALAARYFMWTAMAGFWAGDGLLHLGAGPISRAQVEALAGAPEQFVDLLLSHMRFTPTPHSRSVLDDFARSTAWPHWPNLVLLVLMLPEMHTA